MATQVFVGSIGIKAGESSPVSILLDGATGTITGNFDINANVNFTEPGVNATFESLLLSDLDLLPNSTADRFITQLPNSNDVIKITYDGRIGRSSGVGAGDWVLGAPEANNGYSFRINTPQPNLQLYAPDSGGQVALYNTASTGYQWVIAPSGDATFTNLVVRTDAFLNGTATVNGLFTATEVEVGGNVEVDGVVNASGLLINGVPVEKDSAIPVFVNANYTVPNDGNDYELYIDGAGQSITVLIPEDPPTQQHINIVIYDNNFGVGGTCGVGTGVPGLQFVGKGVQGSTITLVSPTGSFSPGGLNSYSGPNLANTAVSLKYVNYGLPGDWWVWSA